jgi:hypothetical protein
MPMAQFVESNYPRSAVVLLRDPRNDESVPHLGPAIAMVSVEDGPEGLREAVLSAVSKA